jgi:hypothetical protein
MAALVLWLRRCATLAGCLLLLVGFCAAAWPLPLFVLDDPTWYVVHVLQVPIDKDRSAGAALPYLWLFFTLPFGVILMALSPLFFYLGKSHEAKHD